MGKKLIIDEIELFLKPPLGMHKFAEIFTKILHWGFAEICHSTITINPDNIHEFAFSAIAEIGELPVLLNELNLPDFPDIALLTLIHRDISRKLPYCLLIFISADKNSAILSWAKYRTKSKQEIRTCVYKSTEHSRTMAITLSELLIDLSDTEFDVPHILRIVGKIDNAFSKESDVTETFDKLLNQLRIIGEKYSDAANIARKNFDYKNCNKYNIFTNDIAELSKNLARTYERWTKLIG